MPGSPGTAWVTRFEPLTCARLTTTRYGKPATRCICARKILSPVCAFPVATGENVEVNITGRELANLKGLRRSHWKGGGHGSAAGCAELIKENVFRAQLIGKLFPGSECVRFRDIRLNDCTGRKRRRRLDGE